MNIGDWISIAAFVGSIMAIYISWRKLPYEQKGLQSSSDSTDADTAGKYQQIADQAANSALKLQSRVIELETLMSGLKADMLKMQTENEDLREWADRLVHQVISLGGTPVKIRKHIDTVPRT